MEDMECQRLRLTKTCAKAVDFAPTACPKKIVAIDKETMNFKGYNPAKITNPEDCIGCAMCAMMCPDVAITVER